MNKEELNIWACENLLGYKHREPNLEICGAHFEHWIDPATGQVIAKRHLPNCFIEVWQQTKDAILGIDAYQVFLRIIEDDKQHEFGVTTYSVVILDLKIKLGECLDQLTREEARYQALLQAKDAIEERLSA